MALTTMYEGKNNSPQTDITSAITASDMVIPVTDISVFPAAPNLATIGTDENAEVIRYNGIEGNTLTGCERGFSGTTAQPWTAATVISRQITKYDLDTLRGNILDLEARKLEALDDAPTAESSNPVKSSGIKTALDAKQNALTFDNTPTATSSNPVTSGGVKTYVDNKILYYQSQTVSVGTAVNSVILRIPASGENSAINANTVVLECTFAAPKNISSNVNWVSYAGYIEFKGICTAQTSANVTLGQKGN